MNRLYIDKNKNIKPFITVTDVSNNYDEIIKGKKYLILDMIQMVEWFGMEKLLSEFK